MTLFFDVLLWWFGFVIMMLMGVVVRLVVVLFCGFVYFCMFSKSIYRLIY